MWDPVGFTAPVSLGGRLIQRQILKSNTNCDELGWDDPLPSDLFPHFMEWIKSLKGLHSIRIPRSLYPVNILPEHQELHVFCDASELAIGFVCYMRSRDKDNNVAVNFVNAASKVAPRCATSIPRLELCAAVEAAKAAATVVSDLSNPPKDVFLYTDSKIVLGYIKNTKRRFVKYIETRVSNILNHSLTENWIYIKSESNPGDIASRPHSPSQLANTNWLIGPEFLSCPEYTPKCETKIEDLDLPEEIYESKVLCTPTIEKYSGQTWVFDRFSSLVIVLQLAKIVFILTRHILSAKTKSIG